MKNVTKVMTSFGIITALGVAASEIMLYLVSDSRANLDFVIKSKPDAKSEKREMLIKESLKWFDTVESEELYIESRDGIRLHATYIPPKGKLKKIALCVHGIKSYGKREFCIQAKDFYENSIGTFLIDQRGCGKSEGKYVTYGRKEADDCYRWLGFINEKWGKKTDIFIYGISMGSASVMLLNDYRLPSNVKYLVADCGYSSVKTQLTDTFKSLKIPSKVAYFCYGMACFMHSIYEPNAVNPIESMEKCELPVIIAHGSEDSVISVENAYAIYDACPSKDKKLFIVEGAGHTESYSLSKELRDLIINK